MKNKKTGPNIEHSYQKQSMYWDILIKRYGSLEKAKEAVKLSKVMVDPYERYKK